MQKINVKLTLLDWSDDDILEMKGSAEEEPKTKYSSLISRARVEYRFYKWQ